MPRLKQQEELCSVARALQLIGERWTLLVVRDAFYGVSRFQDFQESIGLARNVLSDRLGKLVAGGVLEAVPIGEGGWHEYRLTAMGRDLLPALLALMQWGDRWLSSPADCADLSALAQRTGIGRQGHQVGGRAWYPPSPGRAPGAGLPAGDCPAQDGRRSVS